jgi:hypothetical protein
LSIDAKGTFVGHPEIGEIPLGGIPSLHHSKVNTLGSLPELGDFPGRRGDSRVNFIGGSSDELSFVGQLRHPGLTDIGSLQQPEAVRGDQQGKELIPPSWLPSVDTNGSSVLR